MLSPSSKAAFVAAMSLIGLPMGGQQSKWASSDDRVAQSLIQSERRWAEAACDGNTEAETFLADDFQGTAPDGTRYSKANDMEDTKSSKTKARDCRLGDVKVHFFGDNVAILYGTEMRTEKDPAGKDRTRSQVWTDTWLKRDEKWQIVSAQDNLLQVK